MNNGEQFFNTSGGGGYAIERSLRFNSADSAYLSRTPASAGNRKTWTWAGWVKASKSDVARLFAGENASGHRFYIDLSSGNLRVGHKNGTWNIILNTTQVFRDFSAWFHLLVAVDTTQATAANRVKIYVNGGQITSFSSSTYPAQNLDTIVNESGASLYQGYGGVANGAGYFNGYLADIHFIDGQALDPTNFGEPDANGVWQPIEYSGTYGTNGFHLPFSDNSTAASLGDDTSGNNNDWTVNNISVASGAGNDSLVDSPTNGSQTDTGVGGEVTGNYATWNPLDKGSVITLANGNLDASTTAADWNSVRATIGVSSGKYYWEVTSNTTLSSSHTLMVGIGNSSMSVTSYIGSSVDGKGYYAFDGNKYPEVVSYGATYTLNDVIGVALDMDAGTLTFYKNGVSQGQSHSGLTGTWFPALSIYGTASTTLNTGARPFAYTAPSGFKALCTANLPAPTIEDGSTVMDVALYTGNGSTQTISGLGFSPDLVWIKDRSASGGHWFTDIVRGATLLLRSDSTAAENSVATSVTSFTSDGFSLGSAGGLNTNGNAHVAWTWDAGSSTVTNNDGSITSQVRANPTAGFSIVTYTGNGSNATLGHGLGAAPSFYVVKSRSDVDAWYVYHSSLGNTKYLRLNATDAVATSPVWNNAGPSSTTFSVLGGSVANINNSTYVAYCFAPVDGYSSFGSYTGNGSATDGPFQWCGFRPRWVLVKRTDSGGSEWWLWDSARNQFNVANNVLRPNNPVNEETYSGLTDIDITSNGFKLRGNGTDVNASGGTHVFAAFAESPFQYARAR